VCWRKKKKQCRGLLFCVWEEANGVTTWCRFLLRWCSSEEGNCNITFFFGGVKGLIWWFLDVYKGQGTIKEEFVANAIQVEMQCCHLYIAHHAVKASNATCSYWAKHKIVDNDMV
jgi:hypothetical protein